MLSRLFRDVLVARQTFSFFLRKLRTVCEMEEITLICAETNTEYKIKLSSEDATKARIDNEFSYMLLEKERNKTITLQSYGDNVTSQASTQSTDENTDNASCSNAENIVELKDQHIWTRSETMLLIDWYKRYRETSKKLTPSKHCWNYISKRMEDAGYEIPPIKCATKFQSLKRTYKTVTDHNKKSGNNRKHWEFYEIMHEIFGTKPWVNPISTAGSGVTDTNNNTENQDPNKDSKVSKKRKLSAIDDYVSKSLTLKEEKERNAQKRHEEKMAYLQKIESLMVKMIDK